MKIPLKIRHLTEALVDAGVQIHKPHEVKIDELVDAVIRNYPSIGRQETGRQAVENVATDRLMEYAHGRRVI